MTHYTYSVIGGVNEYECDVSSLQLFDRKSQAEQYAKDIETLWGYEFVSINVKEIQ
jgi:hypothetical protein